MSTVANKIHDAYITANQQELERLWHDESPKTVLKFSSGKYSEKDNVNHSINSIRDNALWMASPTTFNDPFDCAMNVDYSRVLLDFDDDFKSIYDIDERKEYLDLANHFLNSAYRKQNEQEMRDKYVCCFSEPNNLHSICMWAHYANEHKGFCAEYDFSELNNLAGISNQYGHAMRIFGCIPVKYSNEYGLDRSPFGGVEHILNCVCRKSNEWQSEREWRLCAQYEDVHIRGFLLGQIRPKRIYVGCRASEELKTDLKKVCGDTIELYQMYLVGGTFKIDFHKLT